MIFKIFVLALTLHIGQYSVFGASYSKVYVQSGQEIVPVKYVQYGAPAVSIPGPQIARISAAPVESVVPVASSPNLITPCGTPCVYTGPAIATVPQSSSATPNFVTYKTNIPVVIANDENPTSYEYSYVVYDENTGDHKAQHESSDGSVVRGQYSLIQPDGYVREVHYTADDLNGFNAIVKKFLPVNVEAKDEHTQKDQPALPCHEVSQELLKSLEPHKKNEEARPIELNDGENHEIHTVAASDERSNEENKDENHELSNVESQESIDEQQQQPPKEAHGKPSEALTETSSESSEEKELSDDSVEGHEHTGHEIEPHHENDAVVQTTRQEPDEDSSYHNIIKCVQNAINNKGQISVPLTYIILNSPCLSIK